MVVVEVVAWRGFTHMEEAAGEHLRERKGEKEGDGGVDRLRVDSQRGCRPKDLGVRKKGR